MTPLDHALQYAAAGWRVAWAPAGKKHPTMLSWQDVATTDQAVIRTWYAQHPDANVCVATGPASNLWVLDVDDNPAKNKKGSRTLAALEKQYGDLPLTYATGTGSGGVHYYWTWDGVDFDLKNSVGRLGDDLDTRGIGGQVVAPPSVSDTGPYLALHMIPPVPAPAWLLGLLRVAPKQAVPQPEPVASRWPFAQPARVLMDSVYGAIHPYAAKALADELDIIRAAPHSKGNDTVNRSSFSIGTLVGAGWSGLTREVALAAVRDELRRWTWDSEDDARSTHWTAARAIDQGADSPRPEPVQTAATAYNPLAGDPLRRDPLKMDPLRRDPLKQVMRG